MEAHYMWIGKMTNIELNCISSFLKLNPNINVNLWLYNLDYDLPLYFSNLKKKDANEIYDKNIIFKHGQYDSLTSFADMFRYKLLYIYGGIWLDFDLYFYNSFPTIDILRENGCYPLIGISHNKQSGLYKRTTPYFAWSGIIVINKGEQRLKIMSDKLFTNIERLKSNKLKVTYGQQLLEIYFKNEWLDSKTYEFRLKFCPIPSWHITRFLKGTSVFPILYGVPEISLEKSEIYCIHLWNELRRHKSDNIKKLWSEFNF
jgi:hypothetical protein